LEFGEEGTKVLVGLAEAEQFSAGVIDAVWVPEGAFQ
jgi:hypothetical protein